MDEQQNPQLAGEQRSEDGGSRRDFLRKSAAGVGAAVAAGAGARAFSADQVDRSKQ